MAKKLLLRKTAPPGPTPAAAAPAAGTPGAEWYYATGTEEQGPLPQQDLKHATALGGRLRPDSLVWRFDNPVRVRAGSLPWLFPDDAAFDDFTARLPPAAPVVCPRCHAAFAPEETLFLANHSELPCDLVLGPGNPYRFRPTRFQPDGTAIDPRGEPTTATACPACHAALAPSEPAPPRPAARDRNAPERLPPNLASVEGVRKLVAEILAVLNRTGNARVLGDVNARQYAELCRRANARLSLCRQFLADQQPAAAFDQAEQPPRLLDLCAILPFADADQWAQLCARNRWAVPERVDTAAAAEVEACYATAETFEPAFRALRRTVLSHLPAEALRVLRTLRLMDPENPAWPEDIAAFEAARQAALFEAAAKAIEAEDVATLSGLCAELDGPWQIAPDAELLSIARSELARLRTVDGARRGDAAVATFAAACATQDLEAAAAARAELTALQQDHLYQPGEAARAQLEAGRSWFEEASARREAEAVFARDVAALSEAVRQPEAAAEVERLRETLRAAGREPPSELAAQADRIVQRHHLRQRLRRQTLAAARIAAILVALAALALLLGQALLARQRQALTQQLEQALQSRNLTAFDQALADARHGVGGLFGARLTGTPAVTALRARREDLATTMQSRSAAYRSALETLRQIQSGAFLAPASQVLTVLAAAKASAQPGVIEELAAINRFEESWRADQNARLARSLERLPTLAPPPADVFVLQPFAVATQQVAQYCAQVDEAAGLLGANPKELEKVEPFVAAALPGRSNLQVRLAALRDASSATSLNAYLDVLVRYTDRFTNDTLSTGLALPLASRREYRAALTATADYRQQLSIVATNDAWPQLRAALLKLRDTRALNDLRWVRRKDTGELLFQMDREKAEPNSHGKWAECYLPLSGDTAPLFKKLRVLDEPPYNMGFADGPSRPWHHTEIVNDILTGVLPIARADEGARFVETLFRRIGTAAVWSGSGAPGTNELPNVAFQVQFLVFLAEPMSRLSPFPEWKQIFDELRVADIPQANWICLRSGDVKRINQDGAKALTAIFGSGGLLTRLELRRAALAQLERTPLVWAGYVDFGNPALLHGQSPAPPAGLVVLRPDANRVFTVAVDAGTPGALRLPLIPGEPVLAWSDGAATAPRTAEMAKSVGLADEAAAAGLLPVWYPREPWK
jgi:hypothetical protein